MSTASTRAVCACVTPMGVSPVPSRESETGVGRPRPPVAQREGVPFRSQGSNLNFLCCRMKSFKKNIQEIVPLVQTSGGIFSGLGGGGPRRPLAPRERTQLTLCVHAANCVRELCQATDVTRGGTEHRFHSLAMGVASATPRVIPRPLRSRVFLENYHRCAEGHRSKCRAVTWQVQIRDLVQRANPSELPL